MCALQIFFFFAVVTNLLVSMSMLQGVQTTDFQQTCKVTVLQVTSKPCEPSVLAPYSASKNLCGAVK